VADGVISLGERLKSRREELGISQSQAARELDVARTAYRLWEMEAARPSPDRWRLIARWLGVSVATMLLAEDLIDDQEALNAEGIGRRLRSGEDWDAPLDMDADFFDQEQATIERRSLEGIVSRPEAERLALIVERLRSTADPATSKGWRRAALTKELPLDAESLVAARAAVMGVASDIPKEELETAVQLTSELVADLAHRARGDELGSITLTISVLPNVLRVKIDSAVSTSRPVPVRDDAGSGWRFVTHFASRWGAGLEGDSYVTWFDIDLALPGTPTVHAT
jgi:transcriptional regulator with XRE-family HTH domain